MKTFEFHAFIHLNASAMREAPDIMPVAEVLSCSGWGGGIRLTLLEEYPLLLKSNGGDRIMSCLLGDTAPSAEDTGVSCTSAGSRCVTDRQRRLISSRSYVAASARAANKARCVSTNQPRSCASCCFRVAGSSPAGSNSSKILSDRNGNSAVGRRGDVCSAYDKGIRSSQAL